VLGQYLIGSHTFSLHRNGSERARPDTMRMTASATDTTIAHASTSAISDAGKGPMRITWGKGRGDRKVAHGTQDAYDRGEHGDTAHAEAPSPCRWAR
jgi:hypothetical protein